MDPLLSGVSAKPLAIDKSFQTLVDVVDMGIQIGSSAKVSLMMIQISMRVMRNMSIKTLLKVSLN